MEDGMTQARRLRERLQRDGMIVAPGAYDGLTAKLVAQAGFEAVYMTGAGTAAGLGDADTGYGNELNVFRTVREYESAGVAAIHIEDQGFPKKCGHLDDKEIVPREEWLAKIRAAAAARRDLDFNIIARTDARAVAGLDEAVAHANAALAAGADMAFVEAPQTLDEVAAVPRLVNGPCLLNVVYGGKTPDLDLREAEAMGYRLAILPGLLIKCVVGICEEKLAELKTIHRHPHPPKEMTVGEMFGRVGAEEWDARRTQFRAPGPLRNAAE